MEVDTAFRYTTFDSIQADLANGQLTCRTLVNHYLDKIKETQHLNAYIEVYKEEAQEVNKIDDISLDFCH